MHGPLVASLCSHGSELTPRVPVVFNRRGDPFWHFVGYALDDGVGDRLCVWCEGCGAWVREHKLLKLVSIDHGIAVTFDLPVLSMVHGRAEA